MRSLTIVAAAAAALTGAANASTVILQADLTASPRPSESPVIDVNKDNRLRSFINDDGVTVSGQILFDLSAIPDNSVITGLTLTLYSEGANRAPFGNPVFDIYRNANDNWDRNSVFAIDQQETLFDDASGFSGVRGAPNVFVLDISGVDFSTDLSDNKLTLGLSVPNSIGSYMYFFGSDPVASSGDANDSGTVTGFKPRLQVEFEAADSAAVPLPAAGWLMLAGAGALAARRRKG